MNRFSSWMVPAILLALLGCGDDGGGEPAPDAAVPTDSGPPEPAQQALVSDWLNRRLDLIDVEALAEGATRDDALLASLDLSGYAQAPINAEVTPDGKLALVSLSDGFFALPIAGTLVGASGIPTEPGSVLFVDLESFEVVAELATGDGPMGIAFTEGGKQAVVAHFGSQALALIDVEAMSMISDVMIGPFGEEIALDDSGEVGIVAYSSAGNVRTFASDDLPGTISPAVELAGDSAGVAFFPGTKTAYVVQAPNPLLSVIGGHTVVDASDPSAPVVLDDVRSDVAPIAYPAAPVPARGTVVVPTTSTGKLALDEIELQADGKPNVVQHLEVGTTRRLLGGYGASVDAAGRVLISVPGEQRITVVDLEAGSFFEVPWQGTAAGPMDVALIP
jgi:DNA-binding beta-propeller fold protein YncE